MLRFTIIFALAPFFAAAQTNIDVLHYRFEIELSDSTNVISGKAFVTLLPLKDAYSFHLDIAAPPKGMSKIRCYDKKYGAGLTELVDGSDKVYFTPDTPLVKGQERTFVIEYSGTPSDGLIISKNKYGHRTFFADNWPDRAHYWIPCNDRPDDKASFEFLVTAPSHYRVVSNGVLVEEKNLPDDKKLTHWKEDTPLSTKIMVIGVADFAVDTAGTAADSIPVTSWVYPENKKEGFYDYALAKNVLDFFIHYVGPYPFRKLANVQSKTIFGGMENAGAIFYHENSVVGHREEEMLFVHEIAHQWFGDMASEKNYSHLWLSEGFATYLTLIYTEAKYGQEKFIEGLKNDREEVISYLKTIQRPIVDSITPRRQLINTNNYARAGWVLHMLRRKLGDSVFHKAIQVYYNTYKGGNAFTGDLQQVFEKLSGQKLDTFFHQWLFTPDIPKLDISWRYNPRTKRITVTVAQLQSSGPFQFPLDIQVQGTGGTFKTVTAQINKALQVISIPVKTKPVNLAADPSVSLLYEGAIHQVK